MNGKTIEESRKEYEGSAIQALMEATGHRVCERCYCCDLVSQSAPCWQCGGFEPDWDDEWDDGYCSVCGGEGEIFYDECIGRCDENGHHNHSVLDTKANSVEAREVHEEAEASQEG